MTVIKAMEILNDMYDEQLEKDAKAFPAAGNMV